MTVMYEQLERGKCPLCKDEAWLYRTCETDVIACGTCTTRLSNTTVRDDGSTHTTDTERLLQKTRLH